MHISNNVKMMSISTILVEYLKKTVRIESSIPFC